ncbi:MAG: hydroxyethylthiazole kinase [Streptosporangiaceae bacterium]
MSNLEQRSISDTHAALRARSPLVQCLTNYVSMDIAANVLNAAGASPAMVHDAREAGEFAGLASAVVANIGTLSPPWVEGMLAAVGVAHERGTPWVLDPVAVGATSYRRETVAALLEHDPTVIRGNPSEVLTIATSVAGGRGVDSSAASAEAVDAARALAARSGSVVAVTGQEDFVTDGERALVVRGGHPWMPLITALGCSASALVGACCAVQPDPLVASAAALAILAAAGERAGRDAAGPGSLRWRLLDEITLIGPDDLDGRVSPA